MAVLMECWRRSHLRVLHRASISLPATIIRSAISSMMTLAKEALERSARSFDALLATALPPYPVILLRYPRVSCAYQ